MRFVTLRNASRPTIPAIRAGYCASFLCQLRGLTFRRTLPTDQGLMLVQASDSRLTSSIHMLFVFFDLAVVWINAQNEVVDVKLAKQWRPAYFPQRPAKYVLEIHPTRLNDFHPGDRVTIE